MDAYFIMDRSQRAPIFHLFGPLFVHARVQHTCTCAHTHVPSVHIWYATYRRCHYLHYLGVPSLVAFFRTYITTCEVPRSNFRSVWGRGIRLSHKWARSVCQKDFRYSTRYSSSCKQMWMTYTHAQTHAWAHMHTGVLTHICVLTHMHMCTSTHMDTHAHQHVHIMNA